MPPSASPIGSTARPWGRSCARSAKAEILARSVGVDSAIYKLIAFVIACFFAGIAGSFYAHYLILAHPNAFSLWDSIYAVAYVVIGGTSTALGPILGTVLLIGGFELLREASAYQTVGYALILLLVTRFLPGGLISLGPMSTGLFMRRQSGGADQERDTSPLSGLRSYLRR